MTNELAIRILTGDVLGTSEQTHEAIKMAVKALSLPSAQQWIPASQKPEKSGLYLLAMKRIDIDEEPYHSIEWYEADQQAFGEWFYPIGDGERRFEDVSDYFEIWGWMPLPEPYKDKSEGER